LKAFKHYSKATALSKIILLKINKFRTECKDKKNVMNISEKWLI
jgi:hypothetical protein